MKKKKYEKEQYKCEVCGLVISIDEKCGCVDTCDLICCGKEMLPIKKSKKTNKKK